MFGVQLPPYFSDYPDSMEVVVDADGDWAESRLRSAAAMQFLAVVNTTKSAQTN